LQTKFGIRNTEILILCIQQCLLHTHHCSWLYYHQIRLTGTPVFIGKPFSYRLIVRSKFPNSEIKKHINEHRRNRQTTVQQKTLWISAVFDPVILLSYAYTYFNIRLIVTWQLLSTIRKIQRAICFEFLNFTTTKHKKLIIQQGCYRNKKFYLPVVHIKKTIVSNKSSRLNQKKSIQKSNSIGHFHIYSSF
jgi:hypothetical protein